jgi:hypothetical protein
MDDGWTVNEEVSIRERDDDDLNFIIGNVILICENLL